MATLMHTDDGSKVVVMDPQEYEAICERAEDYERQVEQLLDLLSRATVALMRPRSTDLQHPSEADRSCLLCDIQQALEVSPIKVTSTNVE